MMPGHYSTRDCRRCCNSYGLHSYGLYSYGIYSYDLYDYGLHSYGLYSYGLCTPRSNMAYMIMACVIWPILVMAYISYGLY